MRRLGVSACLALVLLSTVAAHAETAKFKTGPSARLIVTDEKDKLSIGPEFKKVWFGNSAWTGLNLVVEATAAKDKEGDQATIPFNDPGRFGGTAQLRLEYGRGPTVLTERHEHGMNGIAVSAVELGVSFDVASFAYHPNGGTKESAREVSWAMETRLMRFQTVGKRKEIPGPGATAEEGTTPNVRVRHYGRWLIAPQLGGQYERNWKASDEVVFVSPPNAEGLTLGKALRLEGPSLIPKFTAALAFPFEPKTGPVAYAPVVILESAGTAGEASPFGEVVRLRLRHWAFLFDVNQTTSTRLGISPEVNVRVSGNDKKEDVVAGIVVELRTGLSRLAIPMDK